MKNIYLLIIFFITATFVANAQQAKKTTHPVLAKNKEKLEDKIRKYYFVMLTNGENHEFDSTRAADIQAGHMANIAKLYYDGKIKVAGPFGDDGKWRGIFIFDCTTKEEVETLLASDPAIAAGSLVYEIHPWYTAAIGSFVPGKPVTKR